MRRLIRVFHRAVIGILLEAPRNDHASGIDPDPPPLPRQRLPLLAGTGIKIPIEPPQHASLRPPPLLGQHGVHDVELGDGEAVQRGRVGRHHSASHDETEVMIAGVGVVAVVEVTLEDSSF